MKIKPLLLAAILVLGLQTNVLADVGTTVEIDTSLTQDAGGSLSIDDFSYSVTVPVRIMLKTDATVVSLDENSTFGNEAVITITGDSADGNLILDVKSANGADSGNSLTLTMADGTTTANGKFQVGTVEGATSYTVTPEDGPAITGEGLKLPLTISGIDHAAIEGKYTGGLIYSVTTSGHVTLGGN